MSITQLFHQSLHALGEIASAYYYAGRLADAVALLAQASEIAGQPDVGQADRFVTWLEYGKMLERKAYLLKGGSYEEAFATLERARALAGEASDDEQIAVATDWLGFTHYMQAANHGQAFDTALDLLQQALAVHERAALDVPRARSALLFHLGLVYERTDRVEEAIDMYQQARAIARDHDFKFEQSYPARHLGGLHQAAGDFESALTYTHEALTLREEIDFKIFIPAVHLGLGRIHEDMGNTDDALAAYERAFHLAQEIDMRMTGMWAAMRVGAQYKQRHNLEQARQYFTDAQKLADELDHQRGRELSAEWLAELGAGGA